MDGGVPFRALSKVLPRDRFAFVARNEESFVQEPQGDFADFGIVHHERVDHG